MGLTSRGGAVSEAAAVASARRWAIPADPEIRQDAAGVREQDARDGEDPRPGLDSPGRKGC